MQHAYRNNLIPVTDKKRFWQKKFAELYAGKYLHEKSIFATKQFQIKNAKRHEIKIIQKSKSGQFIKEWESIKSASKNLRIDSGNISACCRGKRLTVGGFGFNYKINKKERKMSSGSGKSNDIATI